MYKKIFLLSLSALWALNGFSQYYTKNFLDLTQSNSYFWQLGSNGNNTVGKLEKVCSDNTDLCITFVSVKPDGESTKLREMIGVKGFLYNMKVRNDTIFYSYRTFSEVDSISYWHFGKFSIKTTDFVEYKYQILHLKDTGIGSFGYQLPTNYGLTLVNNNEVILWGEGLDNRQPNPNNVPYRSLFLRLGVDGSQKGDVFWFSANENVKGSRMSDATTDIDGNMVFNYQYRDGLNFARSVYKVMPDNTFTFIGEAPITDEGLSLPKIAVDYLGNYYINPTYLEGKAPGYNVPNSRVGYISKINRQGEVLWTSLVPPYNIDWEKQTEALNTNEIRRISTTKNGDILCTGRVFVRDSFDVQGLNKKKYFTGNGSFIARFDTDGNLLWRHFVIPHKKDGSIRLNSIYDIQESPDGSIITGGRLERDDDIPGDMYDAWLMRLSPDGCLNETCDHIDKYFVFPDSIVATSDDIIQDISISPNPTYDQINITLPDNINLPLAYELVSISGQRLQVGSHDSPSPMSIDVDHLPSGIYIIQMRDAQGKVWRSKWVKQ